jgi:hypothetical protein
MKNIFGLALFASQPGKPSKNNKTCIDLLASWRVTRVTLASHSHIHTCKLIN